MMQRPGSLKVSIFGDQYTIRTDEQESLIVKAADLVDTTMKEIASGQNLDTKSIAVLAALRIAHQMMTYSDNHTSNQALTERIDQELEKLGLTL